MGSEEIKKLKEKKMSELIRAAKGDAQSLFYRWEATRLAFTNVTSAELSNAVRMGLVAGDINAKSGAQDIGSFLRHIGVFEPNFNARQRRENTRKDHNYPGKMIILIRNRIASVLRTAERTASVADLAIRRQEAERLARELEQQELAVRVEAAIAERDEGPMPVTNEQIQCIERYTLDLPTNIKARAYKHWFGKTGGIAVKRPFVLGDFSFDALAVASIGVPYAGTVLGHCFGMVLSADGRLSLLKSIRLKGTRVHANEMMISIVGYDDYTPSYLNTYEVGDQLAHHIHRPLNEVPNVTFHLTKLGEGADDIRKDMLIIISTRPIAAGERLIGTQPPDGFIVPTQLADRPSGEGRNTRQRKHARGGGKGPSGSGASGASGSIAESDPVEPTGDIPPTSTDAITE